MTFVVQPMVVGANTQENFVGQKREFLPRSQDKNTSRSRVVVLQNKTLKPGGFDPNSPWLEKMGQNNSKLEKKVYLRIESWLKLRSETEFRVKTLEENKTQLLNSVSGPLY